MRWNGVMNLRLDTVVSEIMLQLIATRTKYWKDVIDAVTVGTYYAYLRMIDFTLITSSYLTSTLIGSIEMAQFDIKHCRLKLVEA